MAFFNSNAQINQSKMLYPFSADGKKWGICDDSLKVIVEPLYDNEFNFFDRTGFTYVYLNKKVGAISDKGKTIFACKYDRVENYWLGNENVAKVFLNNKVGLLSLKTDKILLPLNYDEIIYGGYGFDIVPVWQNKKCGFVNIKTGKPIGKIEYTELNHGISEGNNAIVSKDFKKGLLNLKTGKLVLPVIYDQIRIEFNNNIERTFYKAEKGINIYIYDANGKVVKQSIAEAVIQDEAVITERQVQAERYDESNYENKKTTLNLYKIKDKSWTVTIERRSKNSTEILETFSVNGYDTIFRNTNYYDNVNFPYSNNILFAVKDGKMGLIDLSNTVKLAFIYDTIKYQSNMNAYLVKKDNLWGILNYETYKEIIKPFAAKFEDYSYYDNYQITKVNLPKGQIGYINYKTGKVYIPGFTL